MTAHYFAADGNYGDAKNLFTCDTDKWTEDDWNEIESETDADRVKTAMEIARKYA